MIKFPVEEWDDKSTNAQQRYLTHGVFRYFGKLPPTLTGRILDEVGTSKGTTVVDLMSGSGTTLVEAGIRGSRAIGVDCNELSVLIARVKTRADGADRARAVEKSFRSVFGSLLGAKGAQQAADFLRGSTVARRIADEADPPIRNFDRWFPPDTATCLKVLRFWASSFEDTRERDIAMVALASVIRPSSTASASAGRIFFDVDKSPPNPFALMAKPLSRLVEGLSSLADHAGWSDSRIEVQVGDARVVALPGVAADTVFLHPPYFALYRYSSDVLRFEIDWLGLSRREIAGREIEDGFKTTDETLAALHVRDMLEIMGNAGSIAREGGNLVIVTADSTLRKEPLPIIAGLVAGSDARGWRLQRRIQRKVRYAQASYHRSADQEITRPTDEILIFGRA